MPYWLVSSRRSKAPFLRIYVGSLAQRQKGQLLSPLFSYRTFVLLKHVGPKDLGEEEICRSYLCCTCSSSLNMGPIVGVWMSNMLHSRLQGRPYTKALPVMSCNFQRKFIKVKWKIPYRRTPFPRHPHRQQHPSFGFKDSPSIRKSNPILPGALTNKATLLYECFGFRDCSHKR